MQQTTIKSAPEKHAGTFLFFIQITFFFANVTVFAKNTVHIKRNFVEGMDPSTLSYLEDAYYIDW